MEVDVAEDRPTGMLEHRRPLSPSPLLPMLVVADAEPQNTARDEHESTRGVLVVNRHCEVKHLRLRSGQGYRGGRPSCFILQHGRLIAIIIITRAIVLVVTNHWSVADCDANPVGSMDVNVVLPDSHVAEGHPAGMLKRGEEHFPLFLCGSVIETSLSWAGGRRRMRTSLTTCSSEHDAGRLGLGWQREQVVNSCSGRHPILPVQAKGRSSLHIRWLAPSGILKKKAERGQESEWAATRKIDVERQLRRHFHHRH